MKELDYPGEPNAGMQNLMKMRVREILLISSLYDSFMLAQDGQLNEVLLSEFVGLNIYQAPIITRTGDAKRAWKLIKTNPRIDLVITTMPMRDLGAKNLVNRIRKLRPDLPLVMLANESTELNNLENCVEIFFDLMDVSRKISTCAVRNTSLSKVINLNWQPI